ncbi:MAG: DUF4347 domain-containing protein [Planctomycetaceae bacterium]|nr:DUF4347 domain-containing protein [Planctomycetaceae bacterium]
MSLFVRLWRAIVSLVHPAEEARPARLRMSTHLGVRKLEERRVLNADLASALLPALTPDFGATESAPANTEAAVTQSTASEVLFIDSRVSDWQTLAAGARAGIAIHVLDQQTDGLTQIADYLESSGYGDTQLSTLNSQLTAIHIVSHGESGTLLLGSGEITSDELSAFSDQLAVIGESLTADGDILLYGCEVGEGARGSEFLQTLSTLTNADVAASTDLTGADFLGGDWELEAQQGDVETGVAFSLATQQSYTTVLASFEVTNTDDSGAGSLRDAVAAANASGGADDITFNASLLNQTITLTTGQINITDALTISGLGESQLSISGNNNSRIFAVDNGVAGQIGVFISDLTLTDGRTTGAGNQGGAIVNLEALTLTNVTVQNSQSGDDSGGIANAPVGTLHLVDSTVRLNVAGDVGGGIGSNGTLTLLRSTLSNNSAGFGGGLFSNGSTTFTDSVVSGNQATVSDGGGIANASGGNLQFISSTLAGNSAFDDAGGLLNASGGTAVLRGSTVSANTVGDVGGGIGNNGSLTLENSTVSGNSADTVGGGIQSYTGSITLTNATVTGNRADANGNATGTGGGVFHQLSVVSINNSIIAGNLVGAGTAASDLVGFAALNNATNQHNLIGDAGSANGLTDGSNGNIVGVGGVGVRPIATILNPTLADHGGPTLTHTLTAGSAALNAGSNALSPVSTTDQRGGSFARVIDTTVDIGAVELQQTLFLDRSGSTLTLTDLAGLSSSVTVSFDVGTNELVITDPDEQLGYNSVNLPAGVSFTAGELRIDLDVVTGVTALAVNADGGDDLLTLDFSNGDFLSSNGIVLTYTAGETGETDGDEIAITGGTIANLTYNVTGTEAGNFDVGGSAAGDIFFTQTEPASITSVLGTVTINIDDGNMTAGESLATSLTQGVADNDGILVLDLPGGLEDITFTAPTVALVINGDADDNDTITISSLDLGIGPAVTINGQGGVDIVTLDTAANLGTNNLSLTAETIQQNAGATITTSGVTTLNSGAGGTISLGETANDFGIVVVTNANSASLADANSLILGNVSTTG